LNDFGAYANEFGIGPFFAPFEQDSRVINKKIFLDEQVNNLVQMSIEALDYGSF